MPKRSVWLVRAAFVYLVLGFTVGSLLLVQKATPLHPGLWMLRPLHVEFLLFGFMVQFAFGVGLWILPRTPKPQSEAPGWWAGVLLNLGVWLAGLGGGVLHFGLPALLGRLAEAVALVIFAVQVWPRVRMFRRSHGSG